MLAAMASLEIGEQGAVAVVATEVMVLQPPMELGVLVEEVRVALEVLAVLELDLEVKKVLSTEEISRNTRIQVVILIIFTQEEQVPAVPAVTEEMVFMHQDILLLVELQEQALSLLLRRLTLTLMLFLLEAVLVQAEAVLVSAI